MSGTDQSHAVRTAPDRAWAPSRRAPFWPLPLVAVAVTASLAGCGLSPSSSCSDFNRASVSDQQAVVEQLLQENGLPHDSSSLSVADVAAEGYCELEPNSTLVQGLSALEGALEQGH